MEAAVGGTPFAAVLHDGEQEISIGSFIVWPSYNVKKFHSVIRERIGISESQVTVYLVDRRGSRVPLTPRVNFPALCREQPDAWFFLVVLKRSSSRRRKGEKPPLPPAPETVLLRKERDHAEMAARARVQQQELELELARAQQLEAARMMYLASMSLGLRSGAGGGGGCRNCEECSMGSREFHHCVNDAVVRQFRSWAGPVSGPDKRPIFPYPEYRFF